MFFFVQHRRNVATKLETPASPLGGERGPPFSASISSILALTLLPRSPHSAGQRHVPRASTCICQRRKKGGLDSKPRGFPVYREDSIQAKPSLTDDSGLHVICVY
jgi:hypothetical protein